ncbi:MAG: MBL fold metallo-hydrolase, partial [bacterium]
VEEKGLALKAILNTHGHIDHTCDNALWKEAFPNVPLAIHKDDAFLLKDADRSGASSLGFPFQPSAPDFHLEPDCELALGDVKFRILPTPGHTPGGVCFLAENYLVAGDTLFYGGVGRWDLPGGDYEQLMESIRRELLGLDDATIVLPGHGEPTTIGRERKENPYLGPMRAP